MHHRWQRLLIATALAAALACPWALLQSAAWVSMLIKYARTLPLAQAVSMTFDGEHPCHLCQAIQAGKAKERQEPSHSPRAGKELTLHPPPPSGSLAHPAMPRVAIRDPLGPALRAEPPPKPPPRDPRENLMGPASGKGRARVSCFCSRASNCPSDQSA